MTHEALTLIALGNHAVLLAGGLAAYYKYGDRTDITGRSLQGTEATLTGIRRLIAASLAKSLRQQLEAPPTTSPTIILEASEQAYVERPSNPLDSERFRDAVREFVEGDTASLIDCRNLVRLRDAWLRVSKRLSHILLAFVAYQALVAAALAFVDRTDVYHFADLAILLSAVPTVLLFAASLVCSAMMQGSHNRILEIRHRYAETAP